MARVIIIGEAYALDSGLEPTHPIAPGGPPPGIWPSPGYPAHPIAPGGPPPGIWGGAPPGFWGGVPGPGYPSHPIAPGGPPVGIWPDPGYPAHPIAPGGPPVGIWPDPGHPEHPIVLPPNLPKPPELPPGAVWPPQYVVVWVPGYGYRIVPTNARPEHPIAPGGPETPTEPPSVQPTSRRG